MESAPKSSTAAQDNGAQMPSWREVFLYFLTLGFINIGGPVAQITMGVLYAVANGLWPNL